MSRTGRVGILSVVEEVGVLELGRDGVVFEPEEVGMAP